MTNVVLVVVAHPDDAEIAMGMRIRDHARRGAHVRVHCLTTGSPGPAQQAPRRKECLAAGAVLGIAEYSFSEIPDTRFTDHRGQINTDLFTVFRETRPDTVYTHFPQDQHLDHSVTANEVTAVALREADNLRYFRSPYSTGFEPTEIFVGTPELLDTKAQALRCFTSQQQLDMDLYRRTTQIAHRQHVHHRIVERFPPGWNCAELFRTERNIVFADQTTPEVTDAGPPSGRPSSPGARQSNQRPSGHQTC
ncbi:PIG-L deacetylase family protein [Streptomyces sp. NPDC056716]|uniref:PIG-L deacetylase family protein n=1 Tax=unclassified Streptomyces TaxID=2593676 RepID=UPI00368C5F1F